MASASWGGVRRWSPPVLLGVLCAGAFGPLLGATAVAGVGLGALTAVGGNILTDVITAAIDRLRDDGQEPTQQEIEDELQRQIEEVLHAGGWQAEQLRSDIAGVLGEIGAVGAAVEEAVRTGDEQLQDQLAEGLAGLAGEFTEFAGVVTDGRQALAAIQETLRRQDAEHRHDRDQRRLRGTQLRLMDEKLAVIGYRTRTRAPEMRWLDGRPYQGLAPFDEDQAEVFYGREKATAELVGKLAEQLSGLGLVVVTGASGAGKSSLLRAGLLPALARGALSWDSAEWPCLVITPTRSPVQELATHLAAQAGTDPATICDSLTERPDQAHLLVRQAVLADAERRQVASSGGQGRLVLVVDQFEELFTFGRNQDHDQEAAEAQRSAFITALRTAASTPCGPNQQPAALVVIAVRADFLDRCAGYPELAEVLPEGLFVVGPMAEPDLRWAITGPAYAAGLEIEPGLVDVILADLRSTRASGGYEAVALPWLSQAMLITYHHRENGRLTISSYFRSGGVRDAIQASAEDTYHRLTPQQQAIARQMFQAMTVVARDAAWARRRISRADLYAGRSVQEHADVDAVLEAFVAQRLIVVSDGTAEIAHDELLRAWPRLRNWLESDLVNHILYSQLINDADEWERHHRDPSFLYRGTQLAIVYQAVTNPARYPLLTGTSREFLDAATHAARRSTRQRHAVRASQSALLVAAIVAAATGINASQIADAFTNTYRVALTHWVALGVLVFALAVLPILMLARRKGDNRVFKRRPSRHDSVVASRHDSVVVVYPDSDTGPGKKPKPSKDSANAPTKRFLTADCPARVSVGDRVNLIVRIEQETVRRPGTVTALRPFYVSADGARVRILVQLGAGLVPLDRLDQEVKVPERGDSDPVPFLFQVSQPGLQRIQVMAWAGGTFVGQLTVEVSAELSAPPTPSIKRTVPVGELRPVPGEVTLQVRRSSEGQYMFQLLSDRTLYDPITESLAGDPSGAVERTIALLEVLATQGRGAASELRLREEGVDLWAQMVPRVIKDQFWELHGNITAFNIATDQDIIPWELLYPLGPRNDAGFLVEQFPTVRRVYDQPRASAISLLPAGFVIPPGSPPSAYLEVQQVNRYLHRVSADRNAKHLTGIEQLLATINSGDAGLLHFACHNSFEIAGAGSSITMPDGDFAPVMLSSAVTTQALSTRTPLVFLNACRSAGAVYKYTRLTGWAAKFMEAGAGGFVGTLWAVPSDPARRFAEAFYDACLNQRQPLGEAARTARCSIRDQGDPTWLAYTVYGDPAAAVG